MTKPENSKNWKDINRGVERNVKTGDKRIKQSLSDKNHLNDRRRQVQPTKGGFLSRFNIFRRK